MKNSPHLILTVDYEIFGNGSGNIDCCVIKPAASMLAITERFHAPITFFVETLEFIALEQSADMKKGVKQIREQLSKAIGSGHDAQLHIHPQWHNAKYLSNGTWKLDLDRWRIGDLEEHQVTDLIQRGKSWLEELLQPVKESYSCNTFRAGGWCIQPSEVVINAMRKNGIEIDSTVAPGFRNSTKGAWSDFRNAPDKSHWRVVSNVCIPAKSGIWEVPIITGKINRLRHMQAIKSSRSMDNGGMAKGCCGSYKGPDSKLQATLGEVGKLLRLGHVMLDFSTMPADVLIDITTHWLARYSDSTHPVPIVAIAHTKNFTTASADALNTYLEWAHVNHIQFSTYWQWLDEVNA